MHLDNYKIIFIAVGLIGILLFSWPTIGLLVKPPLGEVFSELYILGPNHSFDDVPFNITAGVTYSVFLGVGNHLGSSSYYTTFVKFGNETEPLPNVTPGIPSPLPALYEYDFFINNGGNWETPFTFKINDVSFSADKSSLNNITINGRDFRVNEASVWNVNKTGYYYNLIVELWLFNSTLGVSQFHNRSVNLILNMTG